MDLYCPRCGEPWEIDCLHEEAELRFGGAAEYLRERGENSTAAQKRYGEIFDEVSEEFRIQGCAALREFRGTNRKCELRDGDRGTRAAMASAAYDLLGPDIDGAAAMLEDWDRGV